MVEISFLPLALGFAVVGDAALSGLLAAVRLAATEGTAQVIAAGIPKVGEEEDAAALAARQTRSQ